jgi:hypothetical protein
MKTDELKKHPLGMCADESMGLVETLEMATRFPMDRRLAENMRLAGDRSHALAREVIALRKAAAKVEEILTSAMIEHDTADYGPDAENPWTMQEWFSPDDRSALATLRAVLGESE